MRGTDCRCGEDGGTKDHVKPRTNQLGSYLERVDSMHRVHRVRQTHQVAKHLSRAAAMRTSTEITQSDQLENSTSQELSSLSVTVAVV